MQLIKRIWEKNVPLLVWEKKKEAFEQFFISFFNNRVKIKWIFFSQSLITEYLYLSLILDNTLQTNLDFKLKWNPFKWVNLCVEKGFC